MASWLFGASKPKTDPIDETEDTPSVSTADPIPEKTAPTMPNLLYDLQPKPSKPSDQDVKPTSMLDNIPFVLSSQINVNINNYTYSLENTKKCLASVKNFLESDDYNYDFSNDRRLHYKFKDNEHKDNAYSEQESKTHWLHRICLNIFHKNNEK